MFGQFLEFIFFFGITLIPAPAKGDPTASHQVRLDDVYNRVTLEGKLTRDSAVEVGIKVVGGSLEDVISGSISAEIIDGGGGNDAITGGRGNDYLYGGAGNDLLTGGMLPFDVNEDSPTSSSRLDRDGEYVDDDYIVGGSGQDMIIGGQGDDIIITGESGETGSSNAEGDWAAGGVGDDVIFGSRDKDMLDGGAGRDFIEGRGGDDFIRGDGDSFSGAYYNYDAGYARSYKYVYYKDNEGKLWSTVVRADGTVESVELKDFYSNGDEEGRMLVYDPRGWYITVDRSNGCVQYNHHSNDGLYGSAIDPNVLNDLNSGAHNSGLRQVNFSVLLC